jgi:hypothetical protein
MNISVRALLVWATVVATSAAAAQPSSDRRIADADRSGMRIAVVGSHSPP